MKKLLLLLLTTLGFTALLQAQTDVINITNSGGADKIGVGTGSGSPQSSLDVFGSYGQKVTTVSANLTLDVSHNTVVCNPAGGSFIVTLPAASGCSGRVYVIKRNATVTANTVTIAGGATIDGAATFVLNSPNQAIEVFSDGTEWKSRVGGLSGLTTLTAGNDIDFGTSSSPNSIDIEPTLNFVHTINAPASNNLNLSTPAGFKVTVNNINPGTTGVNEVLSIYNGTGGPSPTFYLTPSGRSVANDWYYSAGNTGWFNSAHGGGWYMNDATAIKSYGSKDVRLVDNATTLIVDGITAGGSYNTAAGANSNMMYVNNSTGKVYSLPPVNNATLVTNGSGVPSWQAGTTSSLAWLQTGNSGTTASTSAIGVAANNNFIGTTDAKDFVMATSGLERMRITSNGNVGIGIIAPTSKLYLNHAFTSAGTSESAAFINTSNTATITADRVIRGLQVQALNRQTENGFNGSGFGIDGLAYTDGAHTFNWLRGGNFTAYSNSTSATDQDAITGSLSSGYNNSTGTVTSIYGTYNQGFNNNAGTVSSAIYGSMNLGYNANTGTVATVFGSYSQGYSNSTGPLTTAYGAYNAGYNNNAATLTDIYGTRGLAYINSSGSATNLFGSRSEGYLNNGTGSATTAYGAYNQAYTNTTGNITNAYGSFNRAYITGSSGSITSTAFGAMNEVLKNSNSTGNIPTAYATYSYVRNLRDAADGSITTGYAYYGSVSKATNATDYTTAFGMRLNVAAGATRWGIYTENEQQNYFSNNVGIGTTPAYKLDVNGNFRVGISNTSGFTIAQFSSALTDVPGSTSGIQMVGPVNAHVVMDIQGNDAGDGFYVRVPTTLVNSPTVDKTAFVVKASGNVGVGIASPVYKLDVYSSEADYARIGRGVVGGWPANSAYSFFGNRNLDHTAAGNYAVLQHTGGTTYLNSGTGTNIYFRQNNANQMDLGANILSFYTPSGNVRGYIHASESLAAGGAGFVISTSGSEHISFKDGGTSGDENMVIRGNTGYIGMGTSNPAEKLEVYGGNVRLTQTSASSNGAIVYRNETAGTTNTDWKLVYRDEFQSGTDSWQLQQGIMNRSLVMPNNYMLTNCCSNTGSHRNSIYKKSFDLTNIPHTYVKVKFTYCFIDSWDGGDEKGILTANTVDGIGYTIWSQNYDMDNSNNMSSTFFGNSSHRDHCTDGEASFYHTTSTLWLRFGSYLGDNPDDESFAIDNVEVWVR